METGTKCNVFLIRTGSWHISQFITCQCKCHASHKTVQFIIKTFLWTLSQIFARRLKEAQCSAFTHIVFDTGTSSCWDDKPLSNSTLLHVLDITNTYWGPKTRLQSKKMSTHPKKWKSRTQQQTHLQTIYPAQRLKRTQTELTCNSKPV